MDKLVYTALTALQRTTEAQAITANNLANLSTPGFRQEIAHFSTKWLEDYRGQLASRVQAGGDAPANLHSTGKIQVTGGQLDVAIDGEAWLQVTDRNGNPALTRRGDLHIAPDGRVVTGAGHALISNGSEITVPSSFNSLRINANGSLQILPLGEADWVEVGQISLQSAPLESLIRGEDGLFRSELAQADSNSRLRVGALELSNFDSSRALIELVEQHRLFEVQTRLLSAAREMDESSAPLMRVT